MNSESAMCEIGPAGADDGQCASGLVLSFGRALQAVSCLDGVGITP